MFASKSSDQLAFVSRQLSGLLAEESVESALRRLQQASPTQYANEIAYLQALLTDAPSAAGADRRGPYQTLAQLLAAATSSKSVFFRHFMTYVQQSRVVFEAYWTGVVGMTIYLAALSIMAVTVAAIFSGLVIPGFSEMFASFGAPMPRLTTLVFAFGGSGVTLLGVVLAIVVVLVALFVALFRRRISAFAPLPAWATKTPMIREVASTYNLNLFLNFTRVLIESGVDTQDAVAAAAKTANQSEQLSVANLAAGDSQLTSQTAFTELGIAAKLGTFNEEIAFQCDQHNRDMSLALIKLRDKFSLILKLIMYVFIGTLIIAMYLPIFRLGAVV